MSGMHVWETVGMDSRITEGIPNFKFAQYSLFIERLPVTG